MRKCYKFCSVFSEGGIRIKDTKFKERVYVAHHARVQLVGNDKIRKIGIGKYTSLSWKCTIGAPVHPFSTITNCTLMYKKYKVVHIEDSLSQKRTMVGNDAWTGCVVTAIDGVHIGNGAITGVGSVVTECIPDYQIWAEISAKK